MFIVISFFQQPVMNGINVVMQNIVKMIMIAYEALVVKMIVVTMI